MGQVEWGLSAKCWSEPRWQTLQCLFVEFGFWHNLLFDVVFCLLWKELHIYLFMPLILHRPTYTYIYFKVCMYTHMYIYTHIYPYLYLCTFIYLFTYIHIHKPENAPLLLSCHFTHCMKHERNSEQWFKWFKWLQVTASQEMAKETPAEVASPQNLPPIFLTYLFLYSPCFQTAITIAAPV